MYARAKLAEKEKDFEKAIEEYEKLLKLDPRFINAAYSKATCENIVGRFSDAINSYNQAFANEDESTIRTSRSYYFSEPRSQCLRKYSQSSLTADHSGLGGTSLWQSPPLPRSFINKVTFDSPTERLGDPIQVLENLPDVDQ